MADPVDQEVEGIRAVLAALTPLSEAARASVLAYVTKRLGVDSSPTRGEDAAKSHSKPETIETPPEQASIHIKALKEQKKPRSANEMAALVAYFLANVASPEARKKTVNQNDIETYFKIAGFPLPKEIRVTLANAKTAGYVDAAGDGEYKLNAVGHNLVVHSMPRGSSKGGSKKGSKKNRK